MHDLNNINNNSPSSIRNTNNNRRFNSRVVKIIIVIALVILAITLIHVYLLHSEMMSNSSNNHKNSKQSTSSSSMFSSMSGGSGSGGGGGFLSSLLLKNQQKKQMSSESYQQYSKRAFESFPSRSDLPKMRKHELHLKPVEAVQIAPHKLYLVDDHDESSNNVNIEVQRDNNNKNNHNSPKRRRNLDVRSIVQNINQDVLLDQGGRKTPDIVGNPVPNTNNNNLLAKKNGNNNNNRKNTAVRNLRVFQVQPLITGSLEWIPDFVKTKHGNIVFNDKLGKENSILWRKVEEDEQENKMLRLLSLKNVGISSQTKNFFEEQVVGQSHLFIEASKEIHQKFITDEDEANKSSNNNNNNNNNNADPDSVLLLRSFFVDAHSSMIANNNINNKNNDHNSKTKQSLLPSTAIRDNIDIARFKMASILGMPPRVLTHTFVVSVLSCCHNHPDEHSSLATRRHQISEKLLDEIQNIVTKVSPPKSVNDDENDEDGSIKISTGEVVAVIVSPLIINMQGPNNNNINGNKKSETDNNFNDDDGLVIYLRNQELEKVPINEVKIQVVPLMEKWIGGRDDADDSGEKEKTTTKERREDFLVVCAVAKS